MAINAAANWYVRAGGLQTNGGGWDSTISLAGINYADSDTPIYSPSDLATSGAGVTTLTSAAAGFTSNMVGNCVRIASGTNFQTGYYFITVFTNTSTVTVDRTPTSGGAGASGVGKVGGAFISLVNLANGGSLTGPTITSPLAAGHTVNIRGAGSDDPSTGSPDWDHSAGYYTFANGDSTSGRIWFIGYNGRPEFKTSNLLFFSGTGWGFSNIKFFIGTNTFVSYGPITPGGSDTDFVVVVKNCIIDQAGFDACGWSATGGIYIDVEFRNSGGTTAGTIYCITRAGSSGILSTVLIGCTVKGWRGGALQANGVVYAKDCLFANNKLEGVLIDANLSNRPGVTLVNCTIDNNGTDGIKVSNAASLMRLTILNCIISNHSVAGKYGLNISVGTTALNDRTKGIIDYNNFYNNTADRNAISAGANDIALDPQYVNSGSNNWAVGTNMKAKGFPGAFRGQSTTAYTDLGAVQRQEPGQRSFGSIS